MILCDNKSGMIVLCQQDHYHSSLKRENNDVNNLDENMLNKKLVSKTEVNRFIVSFKPRVALIPSISEEAGPVLDHTLVRSPAPHILVLYTSCLI